MELTYFKFEKEKSNRWYIVLPEWEGEHDDLEMVLGADTMCDIIAQDENCFEIGLTDEPIPNYRYKLVYNEPEAGGACYYLESDMFDFPVWLCFVTEFVFGKFPKTIYIK